MKMSTRILLGGGLGLWAVLTLFILTAARHVTHGGSEHSSRVAHDDSLVVVDAGTGSFERVAASGAWDITVYHHPVCTVEVEAPHDMTGDVRALREAGELRLDMGDVHCEEGMCRATARVGLPALSKLALEGMSSVRLEHLSLEELTVRAEGMHDVKGVNVLIDRLTYHGEGACKVDLRDQGVGEADLHAEGMGEIQIRMRGGRLSGRVEGIVKVEVAGDVSENTMVTEGLAKVAID